MTKYIFQYSRLMKARHTFSSNLHKLSTILEDTYCYVWLHLVHKFVYQLMQYANNGHISPILDLLIDARLHSTALRTLHYTKPEFSPKTFFLIAVSQKIMAVFSQRSWQTFHRFLASLWKVFFLNKELRPELDLLMLQPCNDHQHALLARPEKNGNTFYIVQQICDRKTQKTQENICFPLQNLKDCGNFPVVFVMLVGSFQEKGK